MSHRLSTFLAVAVVLLLAGPAAADQPDARSSRRDLSVTLSGGVSLGAYEAGYNYLTTEAVKESKGLRRLKLATGASAGAVNALFAALNSCSPPVPSPTDELGWQTWTDVGFEELFDPDRVTARGIFHRGGFDATFERVERIWREGLPADCDVVVGITTTVVDPQRLEFAEDLPVVRQEERFALRIEGRPDGPPRLTNYVDPDAPLPQPMIPLTGEPTADLKTVRQLLYASTAFPLAFPPVEFGYCLHTDVEGRCTEPTRTDSFVDGGIFDNTPLRLAHDLARRGFRGAAGEGGRWRTPDGLDGTEAAAELTYLYVDPDTKDYPLPRQRDDEIGEGFLPYAGRLLTNVVRTASQQELYTLAEDAPSVRHRLRPVNARFPMAGAHLLNFMGFFERDLRRFDYYLGMYDACAELFEVGEEEFHPSQIIGREVDEIPSGWRPFACMWGVFRPDESGYRTACADLDRNLRILVQLALDRLYANCRGYTPEEVAPYDHHHCTRAARGETPPQIAGVPTLPEGDFRRTDSESTFDHTMRLLTDYQFHWEDLGLDRDEAKFGRVKIRRKLLGMLEAFAAAQPTRATRTLLLTSGRTAINQIAYEPPKNWAYLTLGNALEGGASLLPVEWNRSWIRLNVALQLRGTLSLITAADNTFRIAPVAGPEFQLLFATTPVIQPMFGLRAGYQFSTVDDWASARCRLTGRETRLCSQTVTQAYITVAILERLRLQGTLEYYPDIPLKAEGSSFDFLLGLGLHFF
jgi:hypothetical protein